MPDLVLSLFPGIGLLDMAFEAEGFCVVAGPDVCWGRDIRNFHPPSDRFDGVVGGPPCQPFSPLVHLIRANGYEPKHGNLIPEYERVVAEAAPQWFVMEESPFAPVPAVPGYAVSDFVLDNSTLDAGVGMGLPQMRKRRFSFGLRGERAVDLRRWISYAALELPSCAKAVCSADDGGWRNGTEYAAREKARTVTADYHAGDRSEIQQHGAEREAARTKQRTVRGKNDGNPQPWELTKARAVVAREAAGGISEEKAAWQRENRKSGLAPGNIKARSWEECCVLQGLPPDFLSEAPFTKAGKFTVLGNGVPIPMGRAIARAVRETTA